MKITIGHTFTDAYNLLPKKTQDAANRKLDQAALGLNIRGVCLEKLSVTGYYSLKVTWGCRIILEKMEDEGDSYWAVYIGEHDAAYDWTHSHISSENLLDSGYVYVPLWLKDRIKDESESEDRSMVVKDNYSTGLFDRCSDKELLRLIPDRNSLSMIRKINNERELENIESKLSEDEYDMLVMLAAGIPYDDVFHEYYCCSDSDEETDGQEPQDKKLNDAEITAQNVRDEMIRKDEKVRAYFHDNYRDTLADSGLFFGETGTGKTTYILYRIREMSLKVKKGKKILFVLPDYQTALDIRGKFSVISNGRDYENIDILDVDSLVKFLIKDYAARDSFPYRVEKLAKSKALTDLLERAIKIVKPDYDADMRFFIREWNFVCCNYGAFNKSSYLTAPRVGCYPLPSDCSREKIWKIFEKFIELMKEDEVVDSGYAINELILYCRRKNTKLYQYVCIDEAQNFTNYELKLISAISKDSQRLMCVDMSLPANPLPVFFEYCGYNDENGYYRTLMNNFRLTTSQFELLSPKFKGSRFNFFDKDHSEQSKFNSGRRLNNIETIDTLSSQTEIADYIAEKAASFGDLDRCCLVSDDERRLMLICDILKRRGIRCVKLSREKSFYDTIGEHGLRVCSLKRVQGLEFDHIILLDYGETTDSDNDYFCKSQREECHENLTIKTMLEASESAVHLIVREKEMEQSAA